jgi:hypothetical protein
MKILDYFEHPRFWVIVSSTDSKFDNFSDDEIKKRIGDTIVLVSNSHQRKFVNSTPPETGEACLGERSLAEETSAGSHRCVHFVKVKNIDIATSLIGKKNINICLSDSVKLSDIQPISQLLLLSEINVA